MIDQNSHTMSISLELLPPKIQCHILRQLSDTRALLSLIKASPRFLQVYLKFREDVQPEVICNHITSVVLPLALDVMF